MKKLIQLIVEIEENCPLMEIYEKIKNTPFVKKVLLGQKGCLEIADKKTKYVIPYEDIILLQAEGNYSKVFTTDDRIFLFSQTLKKISNSLPKSNFSRTHRSFIINKTHIREVRKDSVLLNKGYSVPLSRLERKSFAAVAS